MQQHERCAAIHDTRKKGHPGTNTRERPLTRLSASSHACFISVTLALFTCTSSRVTLAAEAVSRATTLLGVDWSETSPPSVLILSGVAEVPLAGCLPRGAILARADGASAWWVPTNGGWVSRCLVKVGIGAWTQEERGKEGEVLKEESVNVVGGVVRLCNDNRPIQRVLMGEAN
jgi:hypothetical protein